MKYSEYLKNKEIKMPDTGFTTDIEINPMLFDFQKDIVKWALRKGRAAIFADCGLGKTPIQLEWAAHVQIKTEGAILIIAPLAVSEQTIREGKKFNIDVSKYEFDTPECGIYITNYEQIDKVDLSLFSGIVIDESSILKSYTGKFRNKIIECTQDMQYKLACTATPSPNDLMELGNHAEFVGSSTRTEMLAMFFVHDGGETQKWRLKGHASTEFWKWVCSWAVMIRKPSDLGYDDNDFILPEINYIHHKVKTDQTAGFLFQVEANTLQERLDARRDTIDERATMAAQIVNSNPDKQWLIWCNLNAEADKAKSLIGGAVNVQGSDNDDVKSTNMLKFSSGDIAKLITKPKIAGFGMNWQNCSNVIFLGLNDSFESYYQAVRRCWRFGQNHTVNVHIVTADIEGQVIRNIERKEKDAETMQNEMLKNMKDINSADIHGTTRETAEYKTNHIKDDNYDLYLGDCVEVAKKIKDDSVDYSIFSPPFASLYTYSNSDRDMGNCTGTDDFMIHFRFLITELFRITRPGRLLSFHCMNLPTSKERHGFIGIQDFRGMLIKEFQESGFIFHSEVCIWKDPLIAAVRTKALGLMHRQIRKDSAMCRQGIPDYLVTMRKPGINDKPVSRDGFDSFIGENPPNEGVLSHQVWRRYASPVWMDINPSHTLQHKSAREHHDEKHICPLQLDVIERAIHLWTLEDDLVFSPFMGIGSEGYCSIRMGRRFVGSELKESYFNQAVKNINRINDESNQHDLFA